MPCVTHQNHQSDHPLQVYQPGKGLAFHFDKDEHAMKEKHHMLQPVLSSVLYLTGDATTERLGMQALCTGHELCTVVLKQLGVMFSFAVYHLHAMLRGTAC